MTTTCSSCGKEFVSSEALAMHTQAKHGSASAAGLNREEKQQLRHEEKEKTIQQKQWRKRLKKAAIYGSLGLGIFLLVYWFISSASQETYSKSQVHWHANLAVSVCGEAIPLPRPTEGDIVHGQSFVGTPFMHLHDGPVIHIEGLVRKKEDIMLGKFMEMIGMRFTNTTLLERTNGDLCPDGTRGMVTLLVNGADNPELSNKVIIDGEEYEIRFE